MWRGLSPGESLEIYVQCSLLIFDISVSIPVIIVQPYIDDEIK